MEDVTASDSSVASTTTLSPDAQRLLSSPASEKESSARVALEARAGRTLSDLEWDRARRTLVEFVIILREWYQRAEMAASELGKVA